MATPSPRANPGTGLTRSAHTATAVRVVVAISPFNYPALVLHKLAQHWRQAMLRPRPRAPHH